MGTAIFVIIIIVVLVIVINSNKSNKGDDLESYRKIYATETARLFSSALGDNINVDANFQKEVFMVRFNFIGCRSSHTARQMLTEYYNGLNAQTLNEFKNKLRINKIKFTIIDFGGISEHIISVH